MRGRSIFLLAALMLVGCGGETTPDAHEAAGSFPVDLARASFSAKQNVSATADLVLAVKNTGDKAIPELAVTIWTGDGGVDASKPSGSFNVRRDDPAKGPTTRPVWIPAPGYPKLLGDGVTLSNADSAPAGGSVVAQTDTYTFGSLPANASRTVVWRVTPVVAGDYTVHYAVAAGLGGKAKAVTAGGGPPTGQFQVKIGTEPGGVCVVKADSPGACASS